MQRIIAALICLACFVAGLAVAWAEGPAIAPEILPENTAPRREGLLIRAVNSPGGIIEVSRNRGAHWMPLGHVVSPATAVNPQGYTASKWAHDSAVAATAANGIHIKVRTDAVSGRGVIFTICPGGKAIGQAAVELDTGALIVTDIPGGDLIFGGGLGPYVNDAVTCEIAGKQAPLPPSYIPRTGDVLVIHQSRPEKYPLYVTFENKFGGLIRIEYAGETPRVIGQVLRPVSGIGRFEGDALVGPGRVRANHCGVIDISTAPAGLVGGFQIVPREHASSPELDYIRERTQWMIVGPVSAIAPSFEGLAPLFSGYILPSYRPDDITGGHVNWLERTLSRCMVEFRMKGGSWQPVPRVYFDATVPRGQVVRTAEEVRVWADNRIYTPLPYTADSALRDVTDIRIVFRMADFWPWPDQP